MPYHLTIGASLVFALALSLTSSVNPALAHKRCKTDVFGYKYACVAHKHYRKVRKKKRVKIAHHTAKWRREQARRYRLESNPHCLNRIRVVGTQRLGNDRAKEDAISIWREQVRFDHGSKFADFRNAKGVRSSCTQNRQGKQGAAYFFMCELSAVPCHAKQEAGYE